MYTVAVRSTISLCFPACRQPDSKERSVSELTTLKSGLFKVVKTEKMPTDK